MRRGAEVADAPGEPAATGDGAVAGPPGGVAVCGEVVTWGDGDGVALGFCC